MIRSMAFCPTRLHDPILNDRHERWWITKNVSADCCKLSANGLVLTNFALRTLVTSHHQATTTIWHESRTAKEVSTQRLSRLHSLDGKILTHRLWDSITILARFDAFLCQQLYFGSSNYVHLVLYDRHVCINLPVLKPNLHRSLCHIDIFRYSLPHGGCGCRVLVEFHFQGDQLILCSTLSLLVLLLLS